MDHNDESNQLTCDAGKVLRLRQCLGWTQANAARESGYSSRLIRKLESGGTVKPSTLMDVLQCYHEALGELGWCMSNFIAPLSDELKGVAESEKDSPSNGQNVELIKKYFETVFNQREPHRIPEFIARDVKFSHGEGEVRFGIEVVQQLADCLLAGFDPIRVTFDQVFSKDGQVYCFWHAEMKHVGVFGDVEATQKWVTPRGLTVCRIEESLIVEANDSWDVYDVIRQLNGEPKRWF